MPRNDERYRDLGLAACEGGLELPGFVDDALVELHPKTGPPAPHRRQLLLPLAG